MDHFFSSETIKKFIYRLVITIPIIVGTKGTKISNMDKIHAVIAKKE